MMCDSVSCEAMVIGGGQEVVCGQPKSSVLIT